MSDSSVKDDNIRSDIQLALDADMLASRIDTHGNYDPVLSAKAQRVFCIQYNVQTLEDVGDETDMFARFRLVEIFLQLIKQHQAIAHHYGVR